MQSYLSADQRLWIAQAAGTSMRSECQQQAIQSIYLRRAIYLGRCFLTVLTVARTPGAIDRSV